MIQEQDVITVEGVRKCYGPVKAVVGVTFQVRKNEIFGMVGPNGSGKTTTIECIEGLRHPDEGKLIVLGLDPQRDTYELRERTGVQLQASNLPNRIRVEEALNLFSSFYSQASDWRPRSKSWALQINAESYTVSFQVGKNSGCLLPWRSSTVQKLSSWMS